MLVAPGVPNGMPATMMIRSPTCGEALADRELAGAERHVVDVARVLGRIGCTPQTRASRRAVLRFGVRARTVEFGRSRAMRKAVEPE